MFRAAFAALGWAIAKSGPVPQPMPQPVPQPVPQHGQHGAHEEEEEIRVGSGVPWPVNIPKMEEEPLLRPKFGDIWF